MTPAAIDFESRAAAIRLVLFDIDGVLTDGTVIVNTDGSESKRFGIRDGIAMVWAQRLGIQVGFLSARTSATTTHRAAQLGVQIVYNGVASKAEAYQRIVADARMTDADVAYMGDDVVDLAVMERVRLAAAPADCVPEVRERAHWVSGHPGGRGAARELIEVILKAQNLWEGVVAGYLNEGRS